MGEALFFRPLPWRLSGTVTTAHISCADLCSAFRDGIAKYGVPKNTNFIIASDKLNYKIILEEGLPALEISKRRLFISVLLV